MKYMESMQRLIDDRGYVKHSSGVIDGNALAYTGLHYLVARKLGYDGPTRFSEVVRSVTIRPGLIERAGKPGDRQAHDDYVYLLCCSPREDAGSFAQAVLRHGEEYNWYFDNNDPYKKPSIIEALFKWDKSVLRRWFGRVPGFVAVTKLAASKKLNFWDYTFLTIDLLSTSFRNNGTSGHLMDWAKCELIDKTDSIYLKLVCKFVRYRLYKNYPKGLPDLAFVYFGRHYPMAQIEQKL